MEELDFKKRYYVVYISEYYPVGFLGDVYFTSNSIEECKEFGDNFKPNDYSIFDRELVETVFEAWNK